MERDLSERSRSGDAQAFSRLVGRYEDRIYRMAKHVCVGLPAEEGLSAAETMKILKLSSAAVKSRLHRGRLFLRDEFERAFGAKESRR